MSIHEKIRILRRSKGLSQITVADICKIKQSSIAQIESGKTQTISIEIGKGIAKALGVSFTELFEIESNPTPDVTQKLNDEIESLKSQLKDKNLIIELLLKEREQHGTTR